MTAPVLIEARSGRCLDALAVKTEFQQWEQIFRSSQKQLVLIVTANTIDIVCALHGAWQAGHAVLLCNQTITPNALENMIENYRPEWVLLPSSADAALVTVIKQQKDMIEKSCPGDGNHVHLWCSNNHYGVLHPDLRLLLTTSGSTGSKKLVRLSQNNLASNTADIIQALHITSSDRAALHMPLAYAFGLSVAMTHLNAGGCLVLIEDSITSSSFWKSLRDYDVTSLPGVPYHFELIARLGLERLNIPSVITLAQAGGRLDPAIIEDLSLKMQQRGGRFFVMYGQTEASPRMTTLPAEHVFDKRGSVGLPMAHGHIAIEDGEIIYTGPNVMMGYATNRQDLEQGDAMRGRLATGDQGYIDKEGFLFITGRNKHFAKIDGLRINLQDIEVTASTVAPTAALEHRGQIILFTIGVAEHVRQKVIDHIHLHPSRIICQTVEVLPRLANDKIDLQALRGRLHDS